MKLLDRPAVPTRPHRIAVDALDALIAAAVAQQLVPIVERLTRLEGRPRADGDAGARVLAIIAARRGSAAFLASEAAALPGLRALGWTARRLGKLFERHVGQAAGGYVLERLDAVEHGARLWRIVAVVGESDAGSAPANVDGAAGPRVPWPSC